MCAGSYELGPLPLSLCLQLLSQESEELNRVFVCVLAQSMHISSECRQSEVQAWVYVLYLTPHRSGHH